MDFTAEQHIVRIGIQAKGFYVEADMLVPRPTTYRSRVCDVLNRSEDFLVLTNVSLYEEDAAETSKPMYHEVLIIRKDQIQFAIPLD